MISCQQMAYLFILHHFISAVLSPSLQKVMTSIIIDVILKAAMTGVNIKVHFKIYLMNLSMEQWKKTSM